MSIDQREKTIYRVTIVGSVVNLLLVVFKFVAGIFGRSSAMVADAVHSMSDLFSDVVVLFFVKLSSKPEDVDHAYGHGKYETLASVVVGLLLLAVGIGIFYDGAVSVFNFFRGDMPEQPGWLALVAAVGSIVAKEWLFRYTIGYARKLDSPALKANAWHHRSDALTSVATLIGVGGAMALGVRGSVLDPLAAVVVSFFILKAAYDLMKPGIDELMEKSLPAEECEKIEQIILSTPGVEGFHHLRTRRVGNHVAIDLHVKMFGGMSLRDAHDIASEVERRIKTKFGADTFIGVHMEPLRK